LGRAPASASGTDHNAIVDLDDARRTPGGTLGLLPLSPGSDGALQGPHLRLLILDDDPLVGETVRMMAASIGAESAYCRTTNEFFTQVSEWGPSHILLDLVMPRIDGVEVIQRLAEMGCQATLIIVSGVDRRVLDAAQRSAKQHELPIAGALSKPFSRSALSTLLETGNATPKLRLVMPSPNSTPSSQDLARALSEGEIGPVFQPKVRCSDGGLIGYEALARWTRGDKLVCGPDIFVPLAEQTGQAARLSEYRFLHHDGYALSIIDRGSVIRDESGRAVRMVGSMLDVTPRRELEGRLRQAQKLEAMGQLTGGVADDFNNLLTVILGSAELLCDALERGTQPHLLAEMISTAAQRGAELTSRLLAFGRKQPLQPRLLDLGDLIAGMEAMLVRTLGEHIDVQVSRPDDLWAVEIDPALLESAVLGLAINARDAMGDGGSLTISMANTTFDTIQAVAADVAPGQYVVLTVSDTGHGIAPDLLSKVFEPFFTTKEIGKGSGLGLSMVYGFVKQSGGHIRLRSELGHGTSISLYFRKSMQVLTASPEDSARRAPEGGSELILVVEDDAMVRRHVSGLLGGLGYRVLEATAATPAMELLAANPDVTLLFTDIVMPGGVNGADLAKMAQGLRPDLKVLFTSGYTENAIEYDGRVDPGIELLGKPYSRDRLATSLRKVLR
jgi:signal transduction histidine kinase/FixJ family two-component response regulator